MQFSSQREYTTQATHSSLSFELATAGKDGKAVGDFGEAASFLAMSGGAIRRGNASASSRLGGWGCSCAHRCPGERILQRNHTEAGHGIGGGAIMAN